MTRDRIGELPVIDFVLDHVLSKKAWIAPFARLQEMLLLSIEISPPCSFQDGVRSIHASRQGQSWGRPI